MARDLWRGKTRRELSRIGRYWVPSGAPIPFAAANEDIRNFLFATATLWKLVRNSFAREDDLLPETALARHRTSGGHASRLGIALRER